MVIEESHKYGDIVQGAFYDSYRNLTLKHIMGLTWALKYCSQSQLVLKIDDDIFVNFPLLDQYLAENYPKSTSDPLIVRVNHKMIACFVQKRMKVLRNTTSKWFVSPNEFPEDYFPDFCSGWGYLTTMFTINDLLKQVPNNLPPFWIDDVYVTGILREINSDIVLESMNKWFNIDVLNLYKWIEMQRFKYKWRYLFSNTNGDIALLQSSFRLNKLCYAREEKCMCCFPPFKRLEENKLLKPIKPHADIRMYKISN
ncbi:beta-1:3-galactosyltransferase 5-like protein [Dinothrombium tinctorium]|uniref:Hexosyltransferase n=1 Tax=Dinothrombium tinctorium TaxID=1965070 RepID=A0A3S3P6K9_9ACAR|nr:beta-1:3-galactosyltransferase 5-like protein [Dinothrombium tinctorium]